MDLIADIIGNRVKNNLADTLNLSPSWWKRLGGFIAKWVREDFSRGVFQNDMQRLPYLSKQYTDYKSRRMQTKSGNKRLKAYYAQPIESHQVSFVDMTLTGKLKKSLRPVKSDKLSVTMGYSPTDKNPEKIIGNERYGRVVMGLNEKNQDKAFDMLLKEIDSKILDWVKEDININVGW